MQESPLFEGVDDSSLDELDQYQSDGYILIACGLVALVSVFLLGKFGKIASAVITLGGIVPAFVDPAALIFTFLLVLGGILSFFVKPKRQVA